MRIIVTGSRDWTNKQLIFEELRGIWWWADSPITLVHGGCPTGADRMANEWATPLVGKNLPGVPVSVEIFPADWNAHGKAAGPIRNRDMVASGADICLAFIKNRSRGASHTVRLAESAGIRVVRFDE